MSTRFAKTINVNGVSTDIELIRDGFNLWYPDAKYTIEAKYERVFSQSMWAYYDNVLGDDKHRAIFETETDVTEYMVWRVQRHLSALGITDTAASEPPQPATSTPDSEALKYLLGATESQLQAMQIEITRLENQLAAATSELDSARNELAAQKEALEAAQAGKLQLQDRVRELSRNAVEDRERITDLEAAIQDAWNNLHNDRYDEDEKIVFGVEALQPYTTPDTD